MADDPSRWRDHGEVRRAGPTDLAALADVVQAAYRGRPGPRGWTTEAHLIGGQRADASMLADALARPGTALVVVDDPAPGGGVVAGCELGRGTGGCATFGTFAVRPDRQGVGVGRALIGAAEELAVAWWASTAIRLSVIRQRDDIRAWYERLGYRATGEVEPFPYGDERYGRPRRDDLELVVLAKSLDRIRVVGPVPPPPA